MTAVKFLHSAMTGAPTLAGVAGNLVAVLDACLVNGFGSGVVDSIVIASGVATVTRSAGHPMEVGSIAEISGASVSGGSINGQKRVLSVPTINTYTFDATGITDQTATGTISHKLAPLGWDKPFSTTNIGVYRSPNVAGTRCYLRVDDTGTQNARVVGYEDMSGVSTGTGIFPTGGQVSGGAFWAKSNTADATTRAWVVCGDDRGFVVWTGSLSAGNGMSHYFGDLIANKSPDAYACVLSGATASQVSGSNSTFDMAYNHASTSTGMWTPRSFTGLGSSQPMTRMSATILGTNQGTYSGGSGLIYPNPADNGLFVSPVLAGENTSSATYRGVVPGLYHVPHNIGGATFTVRDPITGIASLPGKTLRALTGNQGVMFTDATGPWR